MADQMVQAARSGVRNISEGSGAAATSRKSEMKLTNVALASLKDELLPDYESFLLQKGLRIWSKESREALVVRKRLQHDRIDNLPPPPEGGVRLAGLSGLAEFIAQVDAEIAANTMLCAIHQACYLLRRQAESQGRIFLQEGGFSEKLYRTRQNVREQRTGRTQSDNVRPSQAASDDPANKKREED